MSEAENSFSCLKIIYISISVNRLFTHFIHVSNLLLDLSLLIYRSSLHIRKISPLSETWIENIFPILEFSFCFVYGISAKYKILFF